MNRIRLLVALLIIWFFFFFSIERPFHVVNISRIAYILAALMAIVAILVPRWREIPLWVLLVAPVPIFLMIKAVEGDPVWGQALPLTVTEICGIAISTILAFWVGNAVNEFESAVAHITMGQIDVLPQSFSTGQAEMYREVRRARHHQRPLSLVAIGIEESSVQVVLDRMVQEAQQAMMRQYVLTNVAKVLCDELEDYDIIAQGDGHFLVLLPEITPKNLGELTEGLRATVAEQVGVMVQIGTSSLPTDAVTFDGLIETASTEMNNRLKPEQISLSKNLSVKHRTT